MGSVKQLQSLLFPALISLFLTALHASATSNISLPGCPDKCGKISVPYPFGIGTGCYRDGFEITCNESKIRPRLFLWSEQENNIEVTNINITSGEAYANNKYFSYLCTNKTISKQVGVIFTLKFRGAFLLSHQRNKFIVIGCRAFAYFVGVDSELRENWSGCLSFCDSLNSTTGDGGQCNGSGCCTSTVAAGLYKYTMGWGHEMGTLSEVNPCNYAVLMDENWYKFSLRDLSGLDFYERNYKIGVPVVLDWAIRDVNGTCRNGVERSPNPACRSNHSSCHLTSNGNGYLCQCKQGYNGNPYLHGGCIDIDECNSTKENPCSKNAICTNTIGNFTCSCPKGTHGNPHDKDGVCIKNPEKFSYPARVAISTASGIIVFLGLCFLIYTYVQHTRQKKEREEYQRYKNMMENYLHVFSKKQIETATNDFAESNVLGSGGQGKVYKGLFKNNQVLAIKKAKEFEETNKEEFVNEIILRSQINHKNIVRLMGCCLDVKIPMLVYEFVPNGTLCEMQHGSKSRPIPLEIRLRIALESAEALDYLHSYTYQSIIHGDVKSANILLENDWHAKVSDFGASNLVPIDDTQIFKVVQGTRGYLDPEYVTTSILTKKSDVYSFGVVLLELITRKCAIFINETSERKHLASCFCSSVIKKQLHGLLDKEIVTQNEKVIGVLHEVSDLAVWCLNVRGEDRPTMRQVVNKLQHLVRIHFSLMGLDTVAKETESLLGESTSSYSSVLEIETRLPN